MKKQFWIVLAVYAVIIVGSVVYFGLMQHFGYQGLQFNIGGRDNIVSPMDILILAATVVSFFLLAVSLLAVKRTNDTRIFIVSFAFFFFMVKELFAVFENFFPREFIYVENAESVFDLLILLSFMMLIYSTYARSKKALRSRKTKN